MTDPEIKTLLQSMADEITDVRPLDHRALGRARTRRLAVAATAIVSVLSLAAGGTSLALSLRGSNGGVVAPAGDETPPPPQPMAGTIVAHGYTDDGHEWWLSAEQDENGYLCTYLQHDTGDIRPHCAPYGDPDDVARGVDDVRGGMFGWVPAATTKLWVTWPDPYEEGGPEDDTAEEDEGEDPSTEQLEESPSEEPSSGDDNSDVEVTFEGETEVPLYDAPEGFPFPVKLYALIPAPANAETLYIQLNSGDATVLIISDPHGHVGTAEGDRLEAEPQGDEDGDRRQKVAEGEDGRQAWQLYERHSRRGLRCIELRWADDKGSSEGCSDAVPDDESVQFAMANFPGGDAVAFFAALSKDVASLRLELDGGEAVEAEVIEGPEGTDVNYAVVYPTGEPGETVGGTVTSRDADGNVLDTMELCQMGPGSGGAMCTSESTP
ncbi:MAG TPA: hypothetical protein VIG64_01165 [Actinomycetota bacterium]|jgi:hypothetical protein